MEINTLQEVIWELKELRGKTTLTNLDRMIEVLENIHGMIGFLAREIRDEYVEREKLKSTLMNIERWLD
ncbi:MAG: hypothetical protein GTO14_25505 [Anaerolineales bacterium]|nr:hypothetical protein [Anaerolineales bacterium]